MKRTRWKLNIKCPAHLLIEHRKSHRAEFLPEVPFQSDCSGLVRKSTYKETFPTFVLLSDFKSLNFHELSKDEGRTAAWKDSFEGKYCFSQSWTWKHFTFVFSFSKIIARTQEMILNFFEKFLWTQLKAN